MLKNRKNIRAVFERADAIDLREGLVAYERYNATMRELSGRYGYAVDVVAAVFVTLSPNNNYAANLRSTASVLEGHKAGLQPKQITVSTYGHCKHRAWHFADGVDFLSVTRGRKVRSFYFNILDPQDPEPVTIDGHMIGVWLGRQIRMKEAAYLKIKYEKVASDFRAVARDVGLLPNQLQAVVWFAWKRINKSHFKPQLGLFCAGDQWRTRVPAAEIQAFPARISA